jgi:hypothetical protein
MPKGSPALGRHVVHARSRDPAPLPEEAGLALSRTEFAGLFMGAEVARAWAVESAWSAPGAGGQRGYTVNLYADGSTTVMAFDGSKVVEDGRERIEGTWHFVAGIGRFAGIEGGGTYVSEGFGDHAYSDVTGTVTAPDGD